MALTETYSQYRKDRMKCWHCRSEVIWSGDHDISEEDEEYDMMTELSCPECNSIIIVYYPKEEKE